MPTTINIRSNPFPLAISKTGAIIALTVGSIVLLLIIALGIYVTTLNHRTSQQEGDDDEDTTATEIANIFAQYGLTAAVPPPIPTLALRPVRPTTTNG
jgi:hypothetical protein